LSYGRNRTGISHNRADFHKFSDVVPLGRAEMLRDFGLQNPCLRMRVCARSGAAGSEL